jgi:hypothetical protein
MSSPRCLCIPAINFWMPEPVFMKVAMYIMALQSISTAYFINPSRQPVCLYVYPLSLLGNGSIKKRNRGNEYATVKELLGASFSFRSLSEEGK